MKTSEMIAMLEKNPGLKFKRSNGEIWGLTEHSKNHKNPYLGFEVNKSCYCAAQLGEDWTLVREPVTWQEAIQAYVDGKAVRCECKGNYKCEHPNKCLYKPTYNGSLCLEGLKRGTWYIEED